MSSFGRCQPEPVEGCRPELRKGRRVNLLTLTSLTRLRQAQADIELTKFVLNSSRLKQTKSRWVILSAPCHPELRKGRRVNLLTLTSLTRLRQAQADIKLIKLKG